MADRIEYTPRPYQPAAIDHIIENPRCALWAGMGTGKGSSVLTALHHLELVEDIYPALVLGPKRVARKTWREEAGKWKHTAGIEVSQVIGDADTRRRALKADANLFTINYENLPWLVEHLNGAWPFKTIIADESTKLKGFRLKQGGTRTHALGRVAHRSSRFIELTGTPSPNGLKDLWGQAWYLDKGERLGRSFEAFKSRWFQSVQVGSDRFATQLLPLPFAQQQIEDRLRDLCLSIDARDYFDLKEPNLVKVEVELPSKARSAYKDMEKEMFLQIAGADIEAFNAASKTMKCLQLAGGAIYTDPEAGAWAEVHDAKIQALESIVEEAAGMPVLVAYQFKHELARLLKAFPGSRHLDTEKDEDDFRAGKIPVLFAHPASAGHGIDGFQYVTNIIAFFGHWWDLELRQQIIERIGPVRQMQAGFDRPVWVYDIVAKDTIDELVLARHTTKRDVQDLLLEAMKGR